MSEIRHKPFTARSVLASALLGEDPPELPVSHLVELAGLFGISGNRARVALSRMVAAGEATTDGSGRYRLAGRLFERHLRQQASRLGGPRTGWSGGWWVAMVLEPARSADERSTRRRRLSSARMAEAREGVWMRPDNLDLPAGVTGDPGLGWLTGGPTGDPAGWAARLWDLPAWSAKAEVLRAGLTRQPTRDVGDLAPGFALSAAVLRHLQADPLLPTELWPPGWAGETLRREYDEWDRAYRDVLTTWGRSRSPETRGTGPGAKPTPRMT
jgi:phenylacetic acid degradation operon negative regulatory protein